MTETETETESETVPAGQIEVTFGVDLSRGVSPSGRQRNGSALPPTRSASPSPVKAS